MELENDERALLAKNITEIIRKNYSFTGNNASDGGAIYFDYSATVINCSFTGNNADNGGAIQFDARTTVVK